MRQHDDKEFNLTNVSFNMSTLRHLIDCIPTVWIMYFLHRLDINWHAWSKTLKGVTCEEAPCFWLHAAINLTWAQFSHAHRARSQISPLIFISMRACREATTSLVVPAVRRAGCGSRFFLSARPCSPGSVQVLTGWASPQAGYRRTQARLPLRLRMMAL